MENKQQQISIEIKPEIAEGKYSNLAIISHSHSEFIVDFAQMFPGRGDKANVCSRVVMAPEHAKRLMNALIDNVNKYERQFGAIEMGSPKNGATFNLADMMQGGNGSNS